jgi:hypothetical protein
MHRAMVSATHTQERATQVFQVAALRAPSRRPAPPADRAELIVSLTSFPARIEHAWIPIARVLRSDLAPDRVVLVLAEDEFPDRQVPERLRGLQRHGLELLWTPRNTYAYKKLVPTLLAYPEATIVTIDDDVFYEPWMLARLVDESRRRPATVIGHRGWAIDHDAGRLTDYGHWLPAEPTTQAELVFLTGAGGILYPPGLLPIELLQDVDLALELAPTADDVWWWAVERATNAPVHCLGLRSYTPLRRQDHTPKLTDINLQRQRNEEQLTRVIEHFGIELPPR